MSYDDKFMNLIDEINKTAMGRGYKNGSNWAEVAEKSGKISIQDCNDYRRCVQLRNQMAHGSKDDIMITEKTYRLAQKFSSAIKNDSQQKPRKEIILPDGCFRQERKRESFIKEFHRRGKDGNMYDFKFSIVHEENLIDDGSKSGVCKDGSYKDGVDKMGTYAKGFFIHILSAPQYNKAKKEPHKFHIIHNPSGSDYICWDRSINSFPEANAVTWRKQWLPTLVFLPGESHGQWSLVGYSL